MGIEPTLETPEKKMANPKKRRNLSLHEPISFTNLASTWLTLPQTDPWWKHWSGQRRSQRNHPKTRRNGKSQRRSLNTFPPRLSCNPHIYNGACTKIWSVCLTSMRKSQGTYRVAPVQRKNFILTNIKTPRASLNILWNKMSTDLLWNNTKWQMCGQCISSDY